MGGASHRTRAFAIEPFQSGLKPFSGDARFELIAGARKPNGETCTGWRLPGMRHIN
jgi:hypothetical protein